MQPQAGKMGQQAGFSNIVSHMWHVYANPSPYILLVSLYMTIAAIFSPHHDTAIDSWLVIDQAVPHTYVKLNKTARQTLM